MGTRHDKRLIQLSGKRGVCVEEIPQRTELQETEKENWMFYKVYKENQKELEKCTIV